MFEPRNIVSRDQQWLNTFTPNVRKHYNAVQKFCEAKKLKMRLQLVDEETLRGTEDMFSIPVCHIHIDSPVKDVHFTVDIDLRNGNARDIVMSNNAIFYHMTSNIEYWKKYVVELMHSDRPVLNHILYERAKLIEELLKIEMRRNPKVTLKDICEKYGDLMFEKSSKNLTVMVESFKEKIVTFKINTTIDKDTLLELLGQHGFRVKQTD